jgi:hypothetical protein
MNRLLTRAVAMTLVVACGLFQFSAAGAAQDRPPQPSAQASEPSQSMQGMTKMHEQMMADMKAAVARLDALVKDMNASSGNAKATAIAAVVTELVAQQKSMHARMGQMHQQMMGRGMMIKK